MDGSKWSSSPDDDGNIRPIGNVFSTMNPDVNIMVVGQNPGANEVGIGEPFVGAPGKVFEEALYRIVNLERKDVYITNTVKCHTQGNRKPTQTEIDSCGDFLDNEVKLIGPTVIVALGSIALKVLTGVSGIMKHSGEVVTSPRYLVPVIAMLHPSPYNINNPERCQMFEKAMTVLAMVLKG